MKTVPRPLLALILFTAGTAAVYSWRLHQSSAATPRQAKSPDRHESSLAQNSKPYPAGDPWLAALSHQSPEQFPGLAAEISALTDPVLRRVRTHALLTRWLELAPQGAAAWVRGRQDDTLSLALYSAWAALDPSAAFDSLRGETVQRKNTPFSDSRDWRTPALTEILTAGAAAFIRRGQLDPAFNPLDFPGADADSTALRALAAADMSLTRRWAESIADKTFSILTMRSLSGILAEQNPAEAIAWATAQSTKRARDLMLETIGPALAARDPDAALAFIQEHKLNSSVLEAVKVLRRQGDDAALAWLQRLDLYPMRDLAAQNLLSDVYARDPDKALRIAAEFGGNAIMGMAGFHDAAFPATLDQLRSAPDSPFRRSLMADAWMEWMRRDPNAAAAALSALPEEPFAAEVRSTLSEMLTIRNLDTAAQLAGTPAGDALGLKPGEVAVQMLGRDSAAAAEMVARLPGEHHTHVQDLAKAWSGMDRPAAIEWAQSLPENSDLRRAAWSGLARQWGNEDYGQFTEWVHSLPEGEDRRFGERMLVVVNPS